MSQSIDEKLSALRNKHQLEIHKFTQNATALQAKLTQKIEGERQALMNRQMAEERGFWASVHQLSATNPARPQIANGNTTPPNPTTRQALARPVPIARKATTQRKSKTIVIDLCGDDDDDTCVAPLAKQERSLHAQLPSPPPSSASKSVVLASQFKTPNTAASVASTAANGPYNAYQGQSHTATGSSCSAFPRTASTHRSAIVSQASGTIPATPYRERASSLVSDITTCTDAATKRKRGTFVLSDDEDDVSEWEPTPISPLADKAAKTLVDQSRFHKKTKVVSDDGTSRLPVPRAYKAGIKNRYGFQRVSTAKPKPNATPTTPRRSNDSMPSTPNAPSKIPKPFATPKTPSTPCPILFSPGGKRRAAIAAEDQIRSIHDYEQEFRTDYAIENADISEATTLPTAMRRMSLTPSQGGDEADTVSALVETSGTPENTVSALAEKPGTPENTLHTSNTVQTSLGASAGHTEDAAQRAKYQATVETDDESDVNYYTLTDGNIIHGIIRRGDYEELDLKDE